MITVPLSGDWDLSSDNLAPDSRFSTAFPELPLGTAFAVGPLSGALGPGSGD